MKLKFQFYLSSLALQRGKLENVLQGQSRMLNVNNGSEILARLEQTLHIANKISVSDVKVESASNALNALLELS